MTLRKGMRSFFYFQMVLLLEICSTQQVGKDRKTLRESQAIIVKLYLICTDLFL